jgi:hypothetical protein
MNTFIALFCITVIVTDLWALLRIFVSIDSRLDKFSFSLLVVLLPFIGILIWRLTGPDSSFEKINKYTQGEY